MTANMKETGCLGMRAMAGNPAQGGGLTGCTGHALK